MAPACTFSLKSNIKFDPSSFVTKELYIKCPVTGEYPPTGMKVSEKERAKMEFTISQRFAATAARNMPGPIRMAYFWRK